MRDDPACPACGASAWAAVGTQRFARTPPPVSAYARLRHKVLFEVWTQGKDEFVARYLLCEACGMVIYAPRPTADDIDAKYRLIALEEVRPPATLEVSGLDALRSREIFAAVRPHVQGPGRLLDFGGGTGALMGAFSSFGFRCGVVDYTPATVPGVERLADTLEDLPDDARFDVALCSHVFEHVADPVAVARSLGERLERRGLLFVEVPLEILGGPPRMREPVTHINFFCDASLAITLERAGFDVIECRTAVCTFANGLYRYGVRALARPSSTSARVPTPRGAALAKQMLGASRWARAAMALRHPKLALNPLRSLRKRLPRGGMRA